MRWLNGYRNRWVLTGALTVIVLSSVNAWGEGFLDNFNRPDGEVGNGWMIWKEGGIESRIVVNEVLIAGQQRGDWKRSGIYRPVEDETRFSFDFKADDNFNVHIELYDYENKRGVDFYTWLGGPISCGYGSNRISIGSTVITGQYYNLVVEKEGAEFTLTLNGQVIGTVTDEDFPYIGNIIHIDEVFIGADAAAGTVGSLHIDNVVIGQPPIIPIFDFNGDGIVDSTDMCIMIDHWGEDYSLCDIGPTPSGDGIVDVEDLKVLAEHLFEDVNDPTLKAHWPLDETEGMYAVDSAGNNNAIIVGGAEWQPNTGQVDGALQLDGISGCAIINPVLNPARGPFSIIAWIKGGAPGQVVVSQQAGANWLALDAEGKLMTELKSSDQLAGPLNSDTVINDGQWHRIGLVWDGSQRKLYVDGVAVAEDTQPGLEGSQMGLYIGVDKNYSAGTFFSGLIDDIRIYNRVVSP
jgi:hypothetical protein